MTVTEMKQLSKVFIAMGFDVEEWVKDWKKIYKEYESEDNVITK